MSSYPYKESWTTPVVHKAPTRDREKRAPCFCADGPSASPKIPLVGLLRHKPLPPFWFTRLLLVHAKPFWIGLFSSKAVAILLQWLNGPNVRWCCKVDKRNLRKPTKFNYGTGKMDSWGVNAIYRSFDATYACCTVSWGVQKGYSKWRRFGTD